MFQKNQLTFLDYISSDKLDEFINYTFWEDFAEIGDITTEPIFTRGTELFQGRIIAKDQGVVAGTELITYIIRKLDPQAKIDVYHHDGSRIVKGDTILTIFSPLASLLKAERLCLNFLGRLCGIATITSKFVQEVEETQCQILDTRKTTPGLRFAEKYAVKVGGGVNHRMGLFDQVMIKDNHIDGGGGITNCVNQVRAAWGDRYKIIVETRNLNEVQEAYSLKVDRILLDNMPIQMMQAAVQFIDGKIPLEASGNITLNNAYEVAATGVDYISTSYITAWSQPLDLSLLVGKENME